MLMFVFEKIIKSLKDENKDNENKIKLLNERIEKESNIIGINDIDDDDDDKEDILLLKHDNILRDWNINTQQIQSINNCSELF